MSFDEMMQAIEEFRRKQQNDIDAFVNGLRESVKSAQQPAPATQRNGFRYVYVTIRPNGSFAVRFQHKYGQRYLGYGYKTREEAEKSAKYDDDSLDIFADAIRREERARVRP